MKARAGKEGAVPTSNLNGKWICPMHPEIMDDKAEQCTECGMDLVKAETLGYTTKKPSEPPVILPSSAVLITGKRALVYVRVKDREKPTFEGREVELGPRAGDFYIVRSGIKKGEDVVVNGNFKIDSALQLLAKPSMMSPKKEAIHSGNAKQTLCPIMGGAINPDVFVDHKGYRIYFCCPGCDGAFNKDPNKYIETMQAEGIILEPTPAIGKAGPK